MDEVITTKIKWNGDIISAKFEKALNDGLYESGHHLLEVARENVPLDQGILSASGTVKADSLANGGQVFKAAEGGSSQKDAYPQIGTAKVVYVSFNTPYAINQHEVPMNHQGGRVDHYLSQAAQDTRDDNARHLAAKLKAVR